MTWSSLLGTRFGMLAVAGLCLTAGLRPAQATLVAPGGSCVGCTAFTSADLGVLQAFTSADVVSPAGASVWTGTLRSAVYTDGVAGGPTDGLVFIYQFVYGATGSEGIHRITDFSFLGFLTDFGYIAGDPDVAGAFVAGDNPFATGTSSATGSTIGFDYTGNLINLGETSYTMVVKTNATSWGAAIAGVTNGATQNAASFAPVPEPGTYGLLALGMGGLIAIARRRKLNA